MEGIDCTAAVSPLRIAAFRAAGKRFVCRYVAPPDPKYDWKRLKRSEVLACKAVPGLELVVVFESDAGRAKLGYSAGAADAMQADAAVKKLGIPSAPIYFAIDFDTQLADRPRVVAYFKGAANYLGGIARLGAYGECEILRFLFDAHAVRYGWDTYAWSHGHAPDPRCHVYQYRNAQKIAGVSVDLDRTVGDKTDFGQVTRPKQPQKIPGHWAITVTPEAGNFLDFTAPSLEGWVKAQGNLQAKGWRRIDAQWIETA